MTNKDEKTDSLCRFIFEGFPVRGEWVSLDASWQQMTKDHKYPDQICSILGQSAVAAALLAASVKMEGRLTLQLQTEGPLSLMVVQSTERLNLRGMAKWDPQQLTAEQPLALLKGQLILTLDPESQSERYQGIVELPEAGMTAAVENYFSQSEQLPTRLWIAVDKTRAVGLLLQKLPGETDDLDAWNRCVKLAETVTDEELLGLSVEAVLMRLFHEETVRLFEPQPASYRCGCSRKRIGQVLQGLGEPEINSILEEQGQVEVNCEYCNRQYLFDAVDAAALFAAAAAVPSPKGLQ